MSHLSDLAVGILLFSHFLGLDKRQWRLGDQVTTPLVLLATLALLGLSSAISPLLALYTLVRWLLALAVYWAISRGDWPIAKWITLLAMSLAVHALIGLGQVIHQGPLGLPGEAALPVDQIGAAVLAVGETHWLRAYGLTVHPNVLGGFLIVGLLATLPLLERWIIRVLWWLMALGLLLSFSRSAWLAGIVVLPPTAIWLAWRQSNLRRPLVIVLAVAGLVGIVGGLTFSGQILSRLDPGANELESRSMQERGALIRIALEVAAAHPITGIGAGNFVLAALDAEDDVLPQPVHNVPLLLTAEVGLLGAFLWMWLWLAPGLSLDLGSSDSSPWLVTLTAAWFAWGIIALWDYYPWGLETGRLMSVSLLGLINRIQRGGAK